MKTATLKGKTVEVGRHTYEGPLRGEHAGRCWTMVRDLSGGPWYPAYVSDLDTPEPKELPLQEAPRLQVNPGPKLKVRRWRRIIK